MPWTKIAIDSSNQESVLENETGDKRALSYAQAIREALSQALARDGRVFVMGEGIDDTGGIFGSTLNLHKKFKDRVFDTPIAENALTGFAVGAAVSGMRPILVHMRMDFMPLSFDQILNHASKLCYMSGGRVSVPLVIRAIIGKGWGSAAQHSQALHALFAHMPGLKVAMPSSAYDVKGLLLASIADDNPVVFVEHRWLYDRKSFVPEEEYLVPFGKGLVKRQGGHVTIVALSLMVAEAIKAADILALEGIEAEVIDPRTINPFDEELIIESVKKTKRLVVADLGWKTGGFAQMLIGRLFNKIKPYLSSDVEIVALPDVPTPASPVLEEAFYKDSQDIVKAVRSLKCLS